MASTLFPILLQVILLIWGTQYPIRGALKGAPLGGRRAEGGGWKTKGRGGGWSADGQKFLLLFSNTPKKSCFKCQKGKFKMTVLAFKTQQIVFSFMKWTPELLSTAYDCALTAGFV